MRTRTAILASVLLAAATVPATGAGEEDRRSRVVLDDATRDVWIIWEDVGGGDDERVRKPAVDVTRAIVRHGHDAIRVELHYVNLKQDDNQGVAISIRTPTRRVGADVSAGPGSWSGDFSLYDAETFERVTCHRRTHDIDYEADTLLVRIPRRCLAHPRWVRVEITNYLSHGAREFRDNPHNTRPRSWSPTARLYRAPR